MPIRGSTNDITGDELKSHTLTQQGRDNWDDIDWGARARKAEEETEGSPDIPLENQDS